jgi:hypothetical protein
MMVGKQRMPESRSYFYQDLMLPVLLDSLRGGWQANELARPLARLKAMDNNGLLRRTLQAWFRHNVQPLATSKALFIHRNTLEYRLNRISELTGLDLGSFDDRLLLYIALQLDEQRYVEEKMPGSVTRPGRCVLSVKWRKTAARDALTGEFFQIGFDFADLIGDHFPDGVNRRGFYA